VLAGVGKLSGAFFEADFGNIFSLDLQVAGLVLFVQEVGAEEALLFAERSVTIDPELWYCSECVFSFFQVREGERREAWQTYLRFG